MTDYAVTFKQVDKYFQNGTQKVLRQMTAEIPKGVILTLVGPSGSGKSTLLSLCNLMLTPDQGEVFIDGKEVRDWNVNKLRKYVGLAFQTPTMLPGTVEDNLMLAARLHQVELQDSGKRLEYVGLPTSLLTRNAAELSGGQKQRVALARTLVNPTSILLLDEVTSALDVSAAREIEQLIVNIQKQEKKTVLWVTHDLEQAKRVGDVTWLLVDGELVEATDTQTFFQQPKKEITRRFLKGEWS
ncbi:ABC transporter ATP-binding protein [Bacillus sp. FJAT-42315]|uniref:ABC transporter ATP-binding protein n=1 Tax=Bacillus sp. FJAT-42315 TaxID=2014077 RepID=UPI000C2480ED|nr:phosphate ABC transporter ATP-binding protein [Bacillus sp. FJAT-42315]